MVRMIDADFDAGQEVVERAKLLNEEFLEVAAKEVCMEFEWEYENDVLRRKAFTEFQPLIAGLVVASAISHGVSMIVAAIMAKKG